jgi:tetratricopeptide (TPR) repeat protein
MSEWLDAEERVERAQVLCESQRWAEALVEMDAALLINPNVGAWHAQRGLLLEELNRDSEAVEAFQRALELEPESADIAVALGIAMIRTGRLISAAEVFEKLAADHPQFEPAYCHRIYVYAELGRHDRAEEMFYLAQQINESCPHCFFHMGMSLAERAQMERAIYCWQKVLEIEPEYGGVQYRIAQAYRALGKWTEARQHYLLAYREEPGDTDILYEFAELTAIAGNLPDAAEKFRQILDLDPQHVRASFALGNIRLAQGEAAKALEYFETVRSNVGDAAEAPRLTLRTGQALMRLDRYTEAADFLKRAVEENKDDLEAHHSLGDCLLLMDRPKEAADCYRRVLAVRGDVAIVHHNLAVCHLRLNQDRAALEHCDQALKADAKLLSAFQTATIAAIRLRLWARAKEMIRRGLEEDSKNEVLLRIQRALGRIRVRRTLAGLFRPFRRRGRGGH